jgi:heme a synthase
MASRNTSHRTAAYRPALAWFAAIGALWVFVLVTLGAFTTSIGAGMVFPDWPLSNGSINPDGWLTDVAMFAEHSHRLTGTVMGMITIVLAVWLWRTESRRWVRHLGYWALGIVVFQGLLGGKRVLLDALEVPGFEMTLGQMLRIPHGVLAQVYVCVLIAIALALSRAWISGPSSVVSAGVRRLSVLASILLLVQLTIAAVMRHNHAGLAIPTFPHSTPDGGLLPAVWSFQVGIHFAHRVMAAVLTVVLVWLAVRIWKNERARGLRQTAGAVVGLLVIQVALGAFTIWSLRGPYITTAHVIGGALLLAVAFGLTCWCYRPAGAGAMTRPGPRASTDVTAAKVTGVSARQIPSA